MKKVFLLETPEAWDRWPEKLRALPREKTGLVVLVQGAGVTRCLRCEPGLFPYFHQFVLDGGKAYLCRRSLGEFGIPEARPPDLFERVPDGKTFLEELVAKGYTLEVL